MVTIQMTDFRLSNPPQVKVSASGKNYAVINGSFWAGKDQQGNNEYQMASVTVFGNDVQRVAGWIKGNLVNVFGKVTKARHFMNQQGAVVTVLDVVANNVEKPFGSNSLTAENKAQPAQQQGFTDGAAGFEDGEDLPF